MSASSKRTHGVTTSDLLEERSKRLASSWAKSDSQNVMNLLASKWAISVVCILQKDVLRFHEIQKTLPSTTQKVLTDTLRRLERNGIAQRTAYPSIPPQVEYKLTPLGLDLLELAGIISEWVGVHSDEIKRAQKSYDRRKKS